MPVVFGLAPILAPAAGEERTRGYRCAVSDLIGNGTFVGACVVYIPAQLSGQDRGKPLLNWCVFRAVGDDLSPLRGDTRLRLFPEGVWAQPLTAQQRQTVNDFLAEKGVATRARGQDSLSSVIVAVIRETSTQPERLPAGQIERQWAPRLNEEVR